MEKNKKKILIILGITITILATIGGISLALKKPTEKIDKPSEINLAEIKKYLEENYDKFNIDGSTSMIPLHQSINDLFSTTEKKIEHNKTVDAFEKFITGENDILLGVDFSDELLAKAKSEGIDLAKKEITKEGFVFLINKNNPVKSLTIAQIKDIYSGKITNWSQVGGDNALIKAFQRNSDSGSQIRMTKFMGNTKLAEENVEYISSMGYVVKEIADYDHGKYSIAYNMYTFTEKQYTNEDVTLLKVNNIAPTDETIFNESYPIVIYNYIYYDKNNVEASKFADNLYNYLLSDEGQELISGSGYVNLNKLYERNKNIEKPYDSDEANEREKIFYNAKKGEFYAADQNSKLLIYYNYPDYVLDVANRSYTGSSKYKNNTNARNFADLVFKSNIPITPFTLTVQEESSEIHLDAWFSGSADPQHYFDIKYNGRYYMNFFYNIDEDQYWLEGGLENYFYELEEIGEFANYGEHKNNLILESPVQIGKENLKNLEFRVVDYNDRPENLKYYRPFN